MQHPSMATHVVIVERPVQQAAIVPHHQIPLPPPVRIHERRRRRVRLQLRQQRPPRLLLHPDHMRRMVPQIQRLRPPHRMRPSDRMIDRRALLDLRLGRRAAAGLPPAGLPAMDRPQPVQASLHRLGQRRIRHLGIGELSRSPARRQLHGMQHGQQRRHVVIRLVGVPEVIPPLRQLPAGLAVGVEVRNGMHRAVFHAVLVPPDVQFLDVPEVQGEIVLLLLG